MTAPTNPIHQLGDSSDNHLESSTPNPSLLDGDDDERLDTTSSSSPPPVEKVCRSPAEREDSFDFDHDVPSDNAPDSSSPLPKVAEGKCPVSGPNDNPPVKITLTEPKQISFLKPPQTKKAYVALQPLPKPTPQNSKLSLLRDSSPSNTRLLQPPLQTVKGQGLYVLENPLLISITESTPYSPL